MRSARGESSIMAYFPSSDAAREAAGELNGAGVGRSQIDRVSRTGTAAGDPYHNPVSLAESGAGPTLLSGVAAGAEPGGAEGVLVGAEPFASSHGSPGYGVTGGSSFLLSLVTSGDNVEQAVEIIRRHGGVV